MANYFPVYKQIWTSTKFDKLNAAEKLIFLYLLTSPTTQNTGIFKILPKQIACDCALDIKTVVASIDNMSKVGVIEYWEEEKLFYIYNMFKFTRGTIKNPKTLYKTILRQEQLIGNHEAWQLFKEENSSFYEEVKIFEEQEQQTETNFIDDS